ncbi:MAG: hypothetical protein KIH67_001540 [Candidatus Moranbacteria bacterium]|nr:hypothetical protein [Candidatus Moranbacteria bacterium]
MSIEEHEKEEGSYLEHEQLEPNIIPETKETFSGGDMHISSETVVEDAGLDTELLAEELSDM